MNSSHAGKAKPLARGEQRAGRERANFGLLGPYLDFSQEQLSTGRTGRGHAMMVATSGCANVNDPLCGKLGTIQRFLKEGQENSIGAHVKCELERGRVRTNAATSESVTKAKSAGDDLRRYHVEKNRRVAATLWSSQRADHYALAIHIGKSGDREQNDKAENHK